MLKADFAYISVMSSNRFPQVTAAVGDCVAICLPHLTLCFWNVNILKADCVSELIYIVYTYVLMCICSSALRISIRCGFSYLSHTYTYMVYTACHQVSTPSLA